MFASFYFPELLGRSPLNVQPPNGSRYPLVGQTRQRRFDGTNFKPRKPLENAATPTRRVHAVLGAEHSNYFTIRPKTKSSIQKVLSTASGGLLIIPCRKPTKARSVPGGIIGTSPYIGNQPLVVSP